MMVDRSPYRVVEGFRQQPAGAAVEACILLGVSCVAGCLGALALDSRLTRNSLTASRIVGGFTFGFVFITCQPYLFPLARSVLNRLEDAPRGQFTQWIGTLLYEQPYVLLPTTTCAGAAAWTAERLFRTVAVHRKPTSHAIRAETSGGRLGDSCPVARSR